MTHKLLLSLLLCAFATAAVAAPSNRPVAADSRIKTFVYNPNDVFTVTTHYGYQSNVEFGEGEEIQTVSVGDRVSWQIIPAARRLFIRAMEESAHTNMTVVTNLRAYQFDLSASAEDDGSELAYVIRFYYPQEQARAYSASMPPMPDLPEVAAAPMRPSPPPPSLPSVSPEVPESTASSYNYRYTYSGSEAIAPVRLFDDGRMTYFKFRNPQQGTPTIFMLLPDGKEVPMQPRRIKEFVAVTAVGSRFMLRQGQETVQVYNEAKPL